MLRRRSSAAASTILVVSLAVVPAAPAQGSGEVVLAANVGNFRTVASGDTLHVFTIPDASSVVHHHRSRDGGRTWTATALGVASVGEPTADGARVAAIGLASGTGRQLLRSFDDGSSWQAPVVVPFATSRVLLHAEQGVLVAVWEQATAGIGQVFASRSLDFGTTWAPALRLDVGHPDQTSLLRQIVGDAAGLYVRYSDVVGGTVVSSWIAASTDLGSTWLPNARPLPAENAIAASAGTLLTTAGGIRRSVDHGATWTPGPATTPSGRVAIDGSLAIAVDPDAWGQVTLWSSQDAGATWNQAAPLLGHMTVFGAYPWVSGDAAGFVYTFMPSCCSPFLSSGYRSVDRGATWRGSGFLGDWGLRPEGFGAALTSQRSLVHVYPGRSVNLGRLVATLDLGYQPYGTATPGTGGIAPTLVGYGMPAIGSTVATTLAEARGGSVAAFAVSFAGEASQTIGNLTVWIGSPAATAVVVTSGTAGAAGTGAATFPIVLPNNASFLGQSAWLQGFVLDPASAVGVAASAGLRMLVR